MGIPYYFYKLSQKYNNIVTNIKPENTDIYCIDFNGIIHTVAHEFIYNSDISNVEDKIIDAVWEKIEYYIKTYKAKKYIICADGVAPAAKMIQQRKRRYLSVYKNKIDDKYTENKPTWDTNAITPGTQFMNKLNIFIAKKIFNRIELSSRLWTPHTCPIPRILEKRAPTFQKNRFAFEIFPRSFQILKPKCLLL